MIVLLSSSSGSAVMTSRGFVGALFVRCADTLAAPRAAKHNESTESRMYFIVLLRIVHVDVLHWTYTAAAESRQVQRGMEQVYSGQKPSVKIIYIVCIFMLR